MSLPLLHSSLYFSIIVQVVTGIIELLALFVRTAPGMALIKQLLGLELAVQTVEGAFYVWLYKNINNVKNITPKRYADWALTTPTMLITLVAYIIYLNSETREGKTLSLIQILRENAVPIAQIVGLGHCTIGHHFSVSSADPRNPRCAPGLVDRSAKSVPAQKAPGTPVMTSAAISSSPAC